MTENVDEQLAVAGQPAGDALHESLIVAHVLKHFHGHDAVVRLTGAEVVHIGGDDFQVAQAALLRLAVDEGLLARRIGNRRDTGVWIVSRHPQGQRAPATAQLQNTRAILQLCALAGQREHLCFGRIQVGDPGRPVAAAVLEVLAQNQLEELGRHFIVLLVGQLGAQRDGTVAKLREQAAKSGLTVSQTAPGLPAQPLRHQAPHTHAHHAIGYATPLAPVNDGHRLNPTASAAGGLA